jgi:hypothetical protein
VAPDQSACRDAHLQRLEVALLSSCCGDKEGEARISEYVPSDLSCCQWSPHYKEISVRFGS